MAQHTRMIPTSMFTSIYLQNFHPDSLEETLPALVLFWKRVLLPTSSGGSPSLFAFLCPYYIADEVFRPNLTEDREGVPMHLEFTVVDVETFGPLSNAFVDVWTCDAAGVYSGFSNVGGFPGGPGGPPGRGGGGHGPPRKGQPSGGPGGPGGHGPHQTNNNTFLRGVQETDSDGKGAFDLIFPGWYQERTTHIHAKIHSPSSPLAALHTGQVYLEEAITAEIALLSP
ncbi:Intradiol ring-cleavage dioxygenase [Mrakia frigida]|uniref:Intradiol ring-cleavage dioxygenase n=1 Tax=Mrakia frigida TaxID=29902 RepID=UPI003FCBFCB0